MATTRPAVRQVPRQLARLAHPEAAELATLPRVDHRAGALAASPADQLRVLLGQTAPGAEQRALDNRPGHAQPLPDLAVGEALELAQDEHPAMDVRHAAERALEVLEPLLALDRDVGPRGGREQHFAAVFAVSLQVERNLLAAPGPPKLVNTGVWRSGRSKA